MAVENQYELLQEVVRKAGINIVTCGRCGEVLLHRVLTIKESEDIECDGCGFSSDPSDFPDLIMQS